MHVCVRGVFQLRHVDGVGILRAGRHAGDLAGRARAVTHRQCTLCRFPCSTGSSRSRACGEIIAGRAGSAIGDRRCPQCHAVFHLGVRAAAQRHAVLAGGRDAGRAAEGKAVQSHHIGVIADRHAVGGVNFAVVFGRDRPGCRINCDLFKTARSHARALTDDDGVFGGGAGGAVVPADEGVLPAGLAAVADDRRASAGVDVAFADGVGVVGTDLVVFAESVRSCS